jgi:hypothetical protein
MEHANLLHLSLACLQSMAFCMIMHVLANHADQVLEDLGYPELAKKLRAI